MNGKLNGKTILLTLVLLDFLALTAWVVVDYGGPLAAMREALSTTLGLLLAFDLMIALTISTVWMWSDARRLGVNPTPYLLLTLMTGSAGPLLYLIRRPRPLA